MDSATPLKPLDNERSNYVRLCRLFVEVGKCVQTDLFDRMCPPMKLQTILNDTTNSKQLRILLKNNVLSMSQWRNLYPVVKSSVTSRDFDPSLQLLLLRTFCGLKFSASGQDNLLPGTVTSSEAGIACIKNLGDKVYCHSNSGSVDDKTFSTYWNEIEYTFLQFGGARYSGVITALKFDDMDDEDPVSYGELLREWMRNDDCNNVKGQENERGKKARKEEEMEGPTDISEQNSGKEEDESAGNAKVNPPKVKGIKIPKISELPETSLPWKNVELPVDFLLFTVQDCELVSCLAFLKEPTRYYHITIGHVYIGCLANKPGHRIRIALKKCSKGSVYPGGSLSTSQKAISLLSPKAIFSVGACSGLRSKKERGKVKQGDIVVSSKLIRGAFKTPLSRDMSNIIGHIAHGWKAPLQNADVDSPKVHCGALLSFSEENKDIIGHDQEAIAVEMEGADVFAAAYNLKTEWLIVKGIKDFVNDRSSNKQWEEFACVMAASLVANLLGDTEVFKDWPHFNAAPSSSSAALTSSDREYSCTIL
ncbi:uncharacterized protein LOC111344229 [Stylophora pistillata]|uniref:uncharacterized protein LOC111344229 n=1 Tax=Stylophora pistillata TaxID=50429 RepID=UPI000C04AF1A|nr:uncharacterized protein LOC111344229 [Stylophora pistillata]XP_022807170.1 uncharacterized protein LOC111344229 [Stylophora pistillata]XP_022807171.1 uncharacterized protein LOC111344229 [Stylophora pistillata]XP_022807172.1 uncharacterized protein LOC111344229 [Stylophora pistillata]XP_022807173.1 uncharacterized protein LOC111344229 [Stylophora pistillata]